MAPELVPLDQEDCWAALAGETVGRMGLPGEPPEVLPVNYALDGESIVVRVDASSSSAGFVGRQVTFEVDRYDSDLRVGWSVLASGVLEDATGDLAGASGGGGALRLEPWAPGAKDRWLRLRPARLTGRSVLGPSRAEGND